LTEIKKEERKRLGQTLNSVIHNFIPAIDKNQLSETDFEETLLDQILNDLEPRKSKLFLAIPHPIIVDYVCANTEAIIEMYKDKYDGKVLEEFLEKSFANCYSLTKESKKREY
jgi:hypothetical protein